MPLNILLDKTGVQFNGTKNLNEWWFDFHLQLLPVYNINLLWKSCGIFKMQKSEPTLLKSKTKTAPIWFKLFDNKTVSLFLFLFPKETRMFKLSRQYFWKVLCDYSFNFTPGYNKISKLNDVKTFLTETFHLNILQPDRDRKHSRFSDCFKK